MAGAEMMHKVRVKLESAPSLQTPGQKLQKSDLVNSFSCMFKDSETLEERLPRDNYHNQALGTATQRLPSKAAKYLRPLQ